MRILNQKTGSLNEVDRLELAKLLIKAGYTVSIGREKPQGKPTGAYIHYVDFSEVKS